MGDVVGDRHGHAREQQRCHFSRHQRNGQPLEDRVEQDDRRADDDGGGGEGHRAEAHRAGVDHGVLDRHAVADAQLDEVDQDDRVPHHDPGAGNEADHRGGGEERAERGVRRQDADQRERDRQHDRHRARERLEPADHQDVDQHDHGRERDAEIAEHLVGDVPLAVPLHRVGRRVERLFGVVDVEGVAFRQPHRRQRPVHAEDGVDRALDLAGHIGRHVRHRAQVLVIDRLRFRHRPGVGEFADRGLLRPEAKALHRIERAAPIARQPQHHRHGLSSPLVVQEPGRTAGAGHLHHPGHRRR